MSGSPVMTVPTTTSMWKLANGAGPSRALTWTRDPFGVADAQEDVEVFAVPGVGQAGQQRPGALEDPMVGFGRN